MTALLMPISKPLGTRKVRPKSGVEAVSCGLHAVQRIERRPHAALQAAPWPPTCRRSRKCVPTSSASIAVPAEAHRRTEITGTPGRDRSRTARGIAAACMLATPTSKTASFDARPQHHHHDMHVDVHGCSPRWMATWICERDIEHTLVLSAGRAVVMVEVFWKRGRALV